MDIDLDTAAVHTAPDGSAPPLAHPTDPVRRRLTPPCPAARRFNEL